MRKILFFMLSVFLLGYSAQGQPAGNEDRMSISTEDELYWNGKRYCMNDSPMASLKGYDSIYPHIPFPPEDITGDITIHVIRECVKNYAVIWKIVDGMLYVSNLKFITIGNDNNLRRFFPSDQNERFVPIEKLTGKKFDKTSKAASIKPISSCGVIPATWFSGALKVKVYPDWIDYSFDEWLRLPYKTLTFKSGKLVEEK